MSGPAGSGSGDSRVLAGVLVAIVATSVVFHAGASIAAAVSGGLFDASVSDSLAALVRIPANMDKPAAAWDEPATVSISTAAFWLVEGMLFLGLLALGTYSTRWVLNRNGKGELGVRGHEGFASARSLSKLHVSEPESGRLTLGYAKRRLLATEEQTSLAVVGPTGCGKTAGFAIPAILEWNGPLIATSVKADLIAATVEHRRRKGKVWIYDPTNCSGQPGAMWTPLIVCEDWQGAQQMAAWMCEAAQPRIDTVSDGDYWYTQARKALAPYLFAAATTERTIADVLAWIDSQEQTAVEAALRRAASIDDEIDTIVASDEGTRRRKKVHTEIRPKAIAGMREWFLHKGGELADYAEQPISEWPTVFHAQLDEQIEVETKRMVRFEVESELLAETSMRERFAPLVSARSLWDKDQRLRDSVFATAQNILSAYSDPAVCDAAERCDIDFDEWLSGDNTIYVVATSHEQARLRPVLTTLVQQAIRTAYDVAVDNDGTLLHPCLVLLDEAGNTAPLRDLHTYASTARSHGISLVTVWQDLAQIKAIYRDRAQTVLNNHRAKLFGTGIADEQTLTYVSRLIGDIALTERNYSRDLGGDRRSISEHTAYRAAAPIDVLRRIRVNEAVLLYGSELPAHIRLRPWFNKSELRALASPTERRVS